MSLQAPLSGTVERGGTNVSTSTPEWDCREGRD